MNPDVLVVIGAGGMGSAIVRRIGSGRTVLLADRDPETLERLGSSFGAEGHRVETGLVDVGDADSVAALAKLAAVLGPVRAVVHTAGLSPAQATAAEVVRVDLLGVAFVLEEFAAVVAPGGAGVVIASMAGHLAPSIPSDDETRLAATPARELGALGVVKEAAGGESGMAYAFAKRANILRVQAACRDWGRRGARVNTISPGVISTTMGAAELASPVGEMMRGMITASATGRIGTADEVAAVAEFLLGPGASYITGTDLLVDGGVVAGLSVGPLPSAEA